MRRDGGDAQAPAVGYRICRKNFSSRARAFRRGIMLVNFTDQGLKELEMFRI